MTHAISTRRIRYTNEEFASEANKVHGNRYCYDRVAYTNNKTPVEIICPKHGSFLQAPTNHLRGKGCRKCAKEVLSDSLRKTNAEFKSQAMAVHGDRYDYSKVDYKQAREKVEIICRQHGSFRQTPSNHLGGKGCPRCGDQAQGDSKRLTTDEFIRRARQRHGDQFDYSNVTYTTAWEPVTMICPKHGQFQQPPVTHLVTDYGCPKCANGERNRDRRVTTEEFLRRAAEVHGNRYDYALVNCIDSKHPVTIICRKHGKFKQTPGDHLGGKGCRKCGTERIAEKQRQPYAEFIRRAREMHGDKYDYSRSKYITARRKIEIICPVHGVFEQTPDAHLSKGCRKCADDELPGAYSLKVLKRNPELAAKAAVLYYVKFDSGAGEQFYKIGITASSVSRRFAGYAAAGYRIQIIREKRLLPLIEAFKIEQELLKKHCKLYNHRPLRGNRKGFKFGGGSECFSSPLPDALVLAFD